MSQRLSTTTGTGFIATRIINTAGIQSLPHCSRKRSPSWAKRIINGVALTGLFLSLLASGKAKAISITFEKIADTNTPIPGGTANFKTFDFVGPSLDDGNVAFLGYGGDFDPDISDYSQEGVYRYSDDKLSVVADTNTPIPSGKSTFASFFGGFSLDNGNVAFSGTSEPYKEGGIYTDIGGKLNVVADKNTSLIPYYELISPSLDNGNVAFLGNDPTDPDFEPGAIYTYTDGKLSLVDELPTPIPEREGFFTGLYSPSLDNGILAFNAEGISSSADFPYEAGIYTYADGKLNIVADPNTPIPGSEGTFSSTRSPSLANGDVAFVGGLWSNEEGFYTEEGIYTSIDGKLNVVADTNTLIPGEKGTFESLYFYSTTSLDNGNVAFDAYRENSYQSGIYTNIGGKLAEVIAKGDLLDGKKVSFLRFGSEGLSGKQIAFTANFKDGSEGVYIATVPEPASVLGTLAFGAFGAGWLLKRRQRNQKLTSHAKHIE